MVFQLRHRFSNVISGCLDVVGCGRTNVGVPQDALDHLLRHTHAVQVAAESASRCMPGMPLGNPTVTLVVVARLRIVISLRLSASGAPIQRGRTMRLTMLLSAFGLPAMFGNMGPLAGFPRRSRCISSRSANCLITGTAARPARVFGALMRPFQMLRSTNISPSW